MTVETMLPYLLTVTFNAMTDLYVMKPQHYDRLKLSATGSVRQLKDRIADFNELKAVMPDLVREAQVGDESEDEREPEPEPEAEAKTEPEPEPEPAQGQGRRTTQQAKQRGLLKRAIKHCVSSTESEPELQGEPSMQLTHKQIRHFLR